MKDADHGSYTSERSREQIYKWITAILSSKYLQFQVALLPLSPPLIATGVSMYLQEGTRLMIMGQDPLVFKRMAGFQHSESLEKGTFFYVSQDH